MEGAGLLHDHSLATAARSCSSASPFRRVATDSFSESSEPRNKIRGNVRRTNVLLRGDSLLLRVRGAAVRVRAPLPGAHANTWYTYRADGLVRR